MLRPSTVPTSVSGRMMKKQMLATANCSERGGRGGVSVRVRMMLYSAAYHRGELDGARCVVVDRDEVDEESGAAHQRGHGHRAQQHLRSEEHTSELQSRGHIVCSLLIDKK